MTGKRKILRILIITTVALIWAQSLLPPDMSSDESGFVLEKIVKPVLAFFLGREPEISEHAVRKLAHFSEFMVLGILVAVYRRQGAGGRKQEIESRAAWIVPVRSLSFCAFIAFIDETIQMFTGRGPAIADVWIDTFGGITGILIILAIFKRKNRTPQGTAAGRSEP